MKNSSTAVIFLILWPFLVNSEWQYEVWPTLDGKPIELYGHQGERVLLPAHTLPAYEIAAIAGADFVEPDLIMTADGHLVCYHDLFLRSGTDVANHPEFADRMMNYTGIVGVVFENIVNNWFIQDFTLEELRTLRVHQNSDGIRPQYFNQQFGIPTFQEYLDVVHKMTYTLNRTIGK